MKTVREAGRIVFYRTDESREHNTAYMIDPDGSNETAVDADLPAAVWSADRRRLAFTDPGALDGRWALPSVMNADGSGLTVLEGTPAVDGRNLYAMAWAPDEWSPDGTLIVGSGDDNGLRGLYTLSKSHGELQPFFIPETAPVDAGRMFGVFGDGRRILFNTVVPQSDGPDSNTLYFAELSYFAHHSVTTSPALRRLSPKDPNVSVIDLEFFDGSSQDISPDGTMAVFCVHFLDTHQTGLFISHLAGSRRGDPVQIVPATTGGISARWSPDGARIAFTSEIDTDNQIWVVGSDGDGLTQLTKGDDGSSSIVPVWSPDGTKLLFQRKRAGQVTLWTMNGDGSNQRQLTQAPVATDWVGPYAWWAGPAS